MAWSAPDSGRPLEAARRRAVPDEWLLATEPGLSPGSPHMRRRHGMAGGRSVCDPTTFRLAVGPPSCAVATGRNFGEACRIATESHRFVLRLPLDLHGRLTEVATRYRRSLNAEIVARLEHSVGGIPQDDVESKLEPKLFPFLETTFRGELSDDENTLIRLFRRLSARQRAALVILLT